MLQANLYRAFKEGINARIVLCKDYEEALRAYHVACFIYDTKHIKQPKQPLLCKETRLHVGDDVRSFFAELLHNLALLRHFYNDENTLLITPISSLFHPLPSHKYCKHIAIEVGQSYSLISLQETLLRYGYERVDMIEMEGEVSFRGDIMDIYPPLSAPYRISFFGDECEEISSFYIDSQRKDSRTISTLSIPPALFSLDEKEHAELEEAILRSDYAVMSKDVLSLGLWYLRDAVLLPAHYPTLISMQALRELFEVLLLESSTHNDASNALSASSQPSYDSLDMHAIETFWRDTLAYLTPLSYHKDLASNMMQASMLPSISHAKATPPSTATATLTTHSNNANNPPPITLLHEHDTYTDIAFRLDRLEPLLTHHANKNITIVIRDKRELATLPAMIASHNVLESKAILHILTPHELILSLESSHTKRAKSRAKRASFALDELSIGEYVVHSEHGIGVFNGIVARTLEGVTRDFIHIKYAGDDVLLLPVENLFMIDRYVATSGSIPIIDRLGKGSFIKLKQKVKEKLFALAGSIISLAAQRNLAQGAIINASAPELAIFAHSAPFTLTSDQERAIAEIFTDISSGRVMDRLLSGDVGFGKTEVAMNAIYAAYLSGYQCALIVPTTLLSAQHVATLQQRLGAFGVRVGRLDRFLSAAQARTVSAQLEQGTLDVIVGTHSVFGKQFKNLGLIIVDEEHKFGVKHKEALKSLRNNAHILSMSATPIPRTLNMALSRIKGMSRLETPPISRKDSRTFIKQKSSALLREIIMRELRRGGQVFYLYNHIASMPSIYAMLKELFPAHNIAMLHSHINARESEEILYKFANRHYHILLCTSIVEAGLHLPNANTMIIDGADRFGLADLHQLRGRIGRGDKEGFCYLLIDSMESITADASKRLLALERNSYLGSGANIAYHDLEIRGGGNLIGKSQSGHIKHIGFSLYLKLLEDALASYSMQGVDEVDMKEGGGDIKDAEGINGRQSTRRQSVELRLHISAYLSPELITSDSLRLELYRRLSLASSVRDVLDIEEEIIDRFGKLDDMSKNFIQLTIIKTLANIKHIRAIAHTKQSIYITLASNEKHTLPINNDDVLETLLRYLHSEAS